MIPPKPSSITRRRFLTVAAGATAGAVLLGACGDDDEPTASDGGGDGDATTTTAAGTLALAQFFGGPMFAAGSPVRAPFGVADADGLLPVDDTPESLSIMVEGPDGEPLDTFEVARRTEGLERGYFPLLFTPPAAGVYMARAEIDGVGSEMAIMIDEAADLTVVQPGADMPAVATPTAADAAGVDPICTAETPCPLHEVSLAAALTEGRPIALLVATPAFCQIAICGPVLDVLLAAVEGHPGVRFLHAEVYADPANGLEAYAPVVSELGLHYEPCLVLVGADGKVVERLDTIYDRSELDERLSALV